MTFKEAQIKLKEIAKGRYYHLSFEFTEYTNKEQRTECHLYIDPGIRAYASTWDLAFKLLEEKLNPKMEEFPND
jgi:hypothetical protein